MDGSEPKAGGVRIDKWLWAVRLFKTRALATRACAAGRVRVEDRPVKASRQIHPGEIVRLPLPDITRTVRVKEILERRVGAGRVPDYAEELTPPEERERQKEFHASQPARRLRGAGRPTKKDRRELDGFFGL